MADFVRGLDASKLILAEAVRVYLCGSRGRCNSGNLQVLSFAISPFNSPVYNLPVFLFGLYVQESHEASHLSLQTVGSHLL
jgi:hypothetical protein